MTGEIDPIGLIHTKHRVLPRKKKQTLDKSKQADKKKLIIFHI